MKFLFPLLLFLFGDVAFARPMLGKPELVAPILVDGVSEGDVWIYPRDERSDFSVHASALLDILSRHLPPDVLTALKERVREDDVLSLADLETTGISADFDDASLELRLRVPLNLRRSWVLEMNRSAETAPILRSERPSGYLNLRVSQASIDNQGFGANSQMLSGRADLVQSLAGVTFETGGIYQKNSVPTTPEQASWVRQDTRFVKDDEDNLLRWTLGDLNVATRGFQQSQNLAGLSLRREFSIRPERTATRTSQTELMIKRDSTVEIYVNGSLYSQMRLPAGRFNLRDFPLLAGQNRVRVKIRDDFGEEESFEFDLFGDAALLDDGDHEFGYQVGASWLENASGDRTYNGDKVVTSLFHRMGLSSSFTAGVNYQNYSYRHLVGAEAVKAVSLGLFLAEAGVSEILGITGSAGRLGWRSPDRYAGEDMNWRLGLDYERRTENFFPVTVGTLVAPTFQSRGDVQISRRFGWRFLAGIGSTLEEGFPGIQARRTSRANMMMTLGRRLRLELAGFRSEQASIKEDRGLATLTWSDEPGHYSVSAYHDSLQHASSLQLNRTNENQDRDWRGSVSYQKGDTAETSGLTLEALMPLASARVDHFAQKSPLTGTESRTSTVGLQSALVWVGTEFAMSQPVNDAFVLVKAKNIPEGHRVIVNPDGGEGRAQVRSGGSAVLREVSSYALYFVNLDATSLPPGYLLDQEFFRVRPGYRAGILINADFAPKTMVKGRLIHADGTPVVLATGELANAQGQLIDNSFFTNRDGNFVFEGLEPGAYVLTPDQKNRGVIRFNVPSQNGEVLDLGTVTLEK